MKIRLPDGYMSGEVATGGAGYSFVPGFVPSGRPAPRIYVRHTGHVQVQVYLLKYTDDGDIC